MAVDANGSHDRTAALLGELEQQRKSLQALSEWQRVILQSSNLSIIATDTAGIILSFNHAAEKMLGYRADEVVNKMTPAPFHDPAEVVARAPELSREIGQTVEPGFDVFVAKTRLGIAEEREWTYIRKDGSRLTVLLSVTAMRDDTGSIQGYLGIGMDLTVRKQLEQKTAEARTNELSRTLIHAMNEAIIGVDTSSPHRIRFFNEEAERLFGLAEADAAHQPIESIMRIVPDDGGEHQAPRSLSELIDAGKHEKTEFSVQSAVSRRVFPVACAVAPVTRDGADLCVLSCQDISERRATEKKLRLSDKVFEYSAEAIMITDANGIILAVNPAFTWLTGYRPDEVIGRSPNILKSGRHDPEFYAAMWQQLKADGAWAGELWDRRKDGTHYPKWLTINAISEHGRVVQYVALFSDISERKANEDRINFLAKHDHLTGLPNRLLLKEHAVRALAQANRAGTRVALLFIDLDRFKNVNDSLGHHVGDQLLIEIANRLSASVRVTDTVVRLGGDEFVVLAEHIVDHNDAAQVAIKIHEALSAPVPLGDKALHTPPSIGISLYPDDGVDIDTLMKHADTAMYQVKASGRNAWMFYAPKMNDDVQERLELENDLRLGLERGEFELHFQPQWEASAKAPFGWEALLRWRHPLRGSIPPDKFIPIAEDTGLILPLGDWVLRAACTTIRQWEAAGLGNYRVAVNLSARQFRQKEIADRVETILKDTGLPPDRLELEITESVLMEDAAGASAILRQLKTHGVRLAIDDFGTGYSSLSYLKSFPIDKLKIDRSFVRDIANDANDAAIVTAVISLATSLGLSVIAEGVESAEQKDFLVMRGCREIQGYLLGRPMPVADAMDYLRRLTPAPKRTPNQTLN